MNAEAVAAPAGDNPPGGARRGARPVPARLAACVLAACVLAAAPLPQALAQQGGGGEAKAPVSAPGALDAIKAALATGTDAIDDLRRMARRGDAAAQLHLGDLHMAGRGVVRNYSIAGIWYERAAKSGNGAAQYNLAQLYLNNQGRPLNVDKARDWLEMAARQGHEAAIAALKAMGLVPPPVEITPAEKKAQEEARARAEMEKAVLRALAKVAQAAGPEVARLSALNESSDALVVKVVGQAPPAESDPDPALASLIDAYAMAVNDNDLGALKALMVPEYAACKASVDAEVYDAFLAEGLDFKILSGYTIHVGAVDPGQPLPFTGMLAYPVRPGHYARIEPSDAPLATDDGTRVFPTAAIVHAVNQDGAWSLVMGCPTAAEVARRQARAKG